MRAPLSLLAIIASSIAIVDGGGTTGPQATKSILFEDVARPSGLSTFRHVGGSTPDKRYIPEVMSGGVCAADFDGDGWTDVFLVNGGSFESIAGKAKPPAHGLFRNANTGTFTNVTGSSGIRNAGWGMGCAVADYDNDGDPDIYVTNFLSPNQLWRNEGGWRFSDVSKTSGTAGPAGRWNAAATFGFCAAKNFAFPLFATA